MWSWHYEHGMFSIWLYLPNTPYQSADQLMLGNGSRAQSKFNVYFYKCAKRSKVLYFNTISIYKYLKLKSKKTLLSQGNFMVSKAHMIYNKFNK